jgi:hypothetical protein
VYLENEKTPNKKPNIQRLLAIDHEGHLQAENLLRKSFYII